MSDREIDTKSTIKMYSPYIELKDEVTPVPSLQLNIADDSLDLTQFELGSEILVYGEPRTKDNGKLWTPPEQAEETVPKQISFLNINVWINHKEQVIKIG